MRTIPRVALLASIAALATIDRQPRASAGKDELARLVAAFEARTGAELVFTSADLPAGDWFEIKRELPASRRVAAAKIALAEAKKYPPGYLGTIGIEAVGVFDGLASTENDGYHPWVDDLGGYRYFGQWNGADALIGAYYTDEQLPLTLNHEIFHHVDATVGGVTSDASFGDDDAAFAAAIGGDTPYPAATISAADRKALARAGDGDVLEDAVSDYTSKNAGEDQAETARWLWSHLADSLVQIAERPELAGSQRLLHVIGQYAASAAAAPDLDWMVDVALGRDPSEGRAVHKVAAQAAKLEAGLRKRLAPDGTFTIWGSEDKHGVNKTLRGDLARFGKVARAVVRAARGVDGAQPVVTVALTRDLRFLARYHEHIGSHWTITAGTERSFGRARDALLAALGKVDAGVAARLRDRPYADLADAIDRTGAIADVEPPPAPDNDYLANVDAEISDKTVRAAIRRVQPATIKLGGGSGVNLDARGVFLTAAHVVDDGLGKQITVRFPDGTEVAAVVTGIDLLLDVAVLEPVDSRDGGSLPWAPLAAEAPTVGTHVVVIGHPGEWTPDGQPTGYQPWTVSTGQIRAFDGDPLDDQRMGGTEHDAWTYWGHSGSPLFDERGHIVALHNSWDSSNAMRHAVRYEAIRHLLDQAGAAYHVAD